MSTVSQLFNVRPDEPTQALLASAFWPGIPWQPNDFADFFRYFNDHIDDLKWPHGVVDETKFAARTFDELIAIVKELGDKRDSPREEALTSIKQLQVFQNKQQTDRQVLNSMTLAAQLWLTIEVRMADLPPYGPTSGAVEYAVWGPKNTLADLCRQQFQISKFIPTAREARLDTGFNAMNLMHICGIKIAWTDNLFDHLHYDQSPVPRSWWQFWQYHGSGGTIRIYPHKFCLARHYETTNVYGSDLLEETMKSLDLLFPFGHDKTRDFLSQELHPFFLAEPTFPRTMDLGDFNFWRRKIVILYDAFNAPPSRVQQMWRDTRNPMQWWTFWLAVLITVLTTVFGVISGYTSFKQVELAKQTYRLSVQQACGQNDLIQQMCPLRLECEGFSIPTKNWYNNLTIWFLYALDE